jgi:hypothetical protein
MVKHCLISVVGLALFPMVAAAQAERTATESERSALLSVLLKNPVIHAAVREGIDAGEKSQAKIVSATKPPQFEDGTVFDFEAQINCAPSGEKLFVRMIKVSGTSFRDAGLNNLSILIQRAG